MKNEGGREAGYCSKMVPDCGDQCLFAFQCCRRFFFKVFPFPVCKAQLIGDWDENRRGAPQCSVRLFFKFFLSVRQYWAPPTPSPVSKCVPPWPPRGGHTHLRVKWLGSQFRRLERKLALCLLCGPVDRCANILAHRCPPQSIGNDDQAWCANNFFFLFDPPPLLAQGASVRQ
jgi:hypothetical protein